MKYEVILRIVVETNDYHDVEPNATGVRELVEAMVEGDVDFPDDLEVILTKEKQ